MTKPDMSKLFSINVFTDGVMKTRLSESMYAALKRTLEEGEELTIEIADAVAEAMKEWAVEKGATHYTHWFQPMTGSTAEKHDSFIASIDSGGRAILELSGKMLITGEADGSSFPSGGLRATFEARGYTTWDCTSPAFVKQDTNGTTVLCIPTAFCSFTGEALDEKTPLLRSMEALSKQSVRVLKHLGVKNVKRVTPTVGGEQEYFLLDKRICNKRKDIIYTGRTLYGAAPARGQELEDQYYAAVSERVSRFMSEMNIELWKLGVPAKTQHNEVAPSQYELAPLFSNANVAVDHNQIIMEMMQKVAERHDLVCLLHEKPYKGVNGSGKHNNWSLQTDTGINLLKPGKSVIENLPFITFFVAVIAAVDEYANILRMCCATPGNQFRLGGHEAPPSVISVYVGAPLQAVLDHLETGGALEAHETEKMRIGVSTLAVLYKDESDRNRTSPFAFTGNKFEFRMVGSSQSLGFPNTALNTIVAETLGRIADRIDAAQDKQKELMAVLRELITDHKRVIFNGNNYSDDWREEAARRNLPAIDNIVDAINVMAAPEVMELFRKHGVLDSAEINARRLIALRSYVKHTQIEATTMLKLAKQKLFPACVKYLKLMTDAFNSLKATGIEADDTAYAKTIAGLAAHINALKARTEALDAAVAGIDGGAPIQEQAVYVLSNVRPQMVSLRDAADALEIIVDKETWPMPSYGEMMFNITNC